MKAHFHAGLLAIAVLLLAVTLACGSDEGFSQETAASADVAVAPVMVPAART